MVGTSPKCKMRQRDERLLSESATFRLVQIFADEDSDGLRLPRFFRILCEDKERQSLEGAVDVRRVFEIGKIAHYALFDDRNGDFKGGLDLEAGSYELEAKV